MRYSHQRERIFRAVSERCDHPTANMIYEQLKVEMPRLSLGTVYRNLNQLADAGRLKKIPLADGSCRFDKTKEAHSHIVCDLCGAVSDVHLPSFEALEQAIAEETGYELRSYDVVLRGVCDSCRMRAEVEAG
ncbi:MAG: transcriptional repressor [Clostridiales bacterium]|nr:transcriptional repressor [Clostridiales bacterium]